MPGFRITHRAREDLKSIARYSERHWGKVQRDNYLVALNARFEWLAFHPQMGKHRTDIQPGYYSFPQGSHVVFYLIQDDHIAIIGIPHREMDIASYFGTD